MRVKVREEEQKRKNAEKSVKELEAVHAAREKEGRLEALRKLTRRRLGVDVSIFMLVNQLKMSNVI